LVPAATETFKKDGTNPEILDDFVGLIAVTKAPSEGEPAEAWKALFAAIAKTKYAKNLDARHATAVRDRASPPPSMKKVNFCIAAPTEEKNAPRNTASSSAIKSASDK
jgi:hypothetical protein